MLTIALCHTQTRASEGTNLHLSTWCQMDVTNQLHTLTTLTSQKRHMVSYTKQAKWAPELDWTQSVSFSIPIYSLYLLQKGLLYAPQIL